MTTFDDRDKACENRVVQDERLRFRAEARCRHAVCPWAAGLLGLAKPEAERDAGEMLVAATLGNGSEPRVTKLVSDVQAAASPASEHLIRRHGPRFSRDYRAIDDRVTRSLLVRPRLAPAE